MIFDTHAHYDDEAFDEDREQLLGSLAAAGIQGIANIGYKKESILMTHRLAARFDRVYEVLGFHPDETYEMEAEAETILPWLYEQLQYEKVIGLGEIGLDYYWDRTDREIQKKWFREQLHLAKELELPVVIHSREAAKDTFDMIRDAGIREGMLVMHCYSYSPEMAQEYLKMGYFLGIGGVVTFKNAKKLKETVRLAPMERLLTETDCPYLTPAPFRGKRNDSGKIPLVIDEIARIRESDRDAAEEVLYRNALRFYRLPG